MPSLSEDIVQVLTESQNNVHTHQRLVKTLSNLYEHHIQSEESLESFFEAFFKPFSNVLLVYKREPAAQRVIDFVTKFAITTAPKDTEADTTRPDESEDSDQEVETTFFSLLLDRLLSLHEAREKAVRFRVCQMLSKLCSLASDQDCMIGSQLVDKVQHTMLERIFDKVPVVRVHAVSSLELLQSPDSLCPITSAFLSLLSTDSSPDVRRCVLGKIAVSDRSLPAVIERTRDVKEIIRREAFLWLADKCSIRHFKIEQRIQLLNDGLNDRSDLVQEACVNGLLRKWSLESLNGDFISLLARLDVESSSEVAGLALWKLFDNFSVEDLVSSMVGVIVASHTPPEDWDDQTPVSTPRLSATPTRGSASKTSSFHDNQATPTPKLSNPKVIAMELLRCEEVFYWSQLCLYLHKKGAHDKLELIVPTTSEFCDYLQRYVDDVLITQAETEGVLQSQFVVQQLCVMFSVMDPSDEVGRRRMATLVIDLLVRPTVHTSLITHLLSQQTKIWPQESHRVEVLTEVIADVRQPTSANMTAQSGDTTTFALGSQSLNVSMLDLKDDSDTLLRCLAISCELLRELKPQRLGPTIRMLKDALLIPCVQNVDPYVRDMALFCLGLLSLLDIHTAREYLLLFVQVSQVDHESVQATALKIVFDLLHVYGFEAFSVGEHDTESKNENSQPSSSEGNSSKVADNGEPNEGDVSGDPGEGGGVSCDPGEGGVSGDPGEGGVSCDSGEGGVSGDSGEGGDPGEGGEEVGSDNETMQRLLNIMANFLEGESTLLSHVAAEGIAKLLLSRRVLSHKLLAKLIVLWYNPVMQEEDRMRSVLGTFFPMFAASDRSCRECFGEVYLPVLSSVFEAPPTSPLYEIDVANMADLVIQLTQPTQTEEECIHDNLGFTISNAVLSDPFSSSVRVFTRSLSQMTFTHSKQSNAADLLVLCEKMKAEVRDKISLKYLEKFKDTLRRINPTYEIVLPESERPTQALSQDPTVSEPHGLTTPLPQKSTNRVMKKAKTTVKKTRPPVAKETKTTAKKGGGRGRRKKIVKFESSSSDESESENLEPISSPVLSQRATSARLSKSVAAVKLLERDQTKKYLSYGSEESDDSLVGEHSPFVKRTASKTDPPSGSRQSVGPLKVLQYEEDS